MGFGGETTEAVFPTYSAIVLAGGRSSRLGVDKASVPVGGRRLLDRVLSVLTDCFADVVVVGRTGWDEACVPVRFVQDETPGLGPLGGLYTGLGVVEHGRALAVGCDMPFINRAVLEELLAQDGGADATVPRTDGRAQPLLAVYDRRVRSVARRVLGTGDRSLMALLRAIDVCYVEIGGGDPVCFSVNTADDLERAEEFLRRGGGQ